jgi:bacillithiol biosynthesis cysteine-adding enzyme BshC
MEPRCVPFHQLPGVSRLAADFTGQFGNVASFYQLSPYNSESYRIAASRIDYPAERRARLVEALAGQNPGHPSLDLLARPDTLVVATGQQVGLFLGPAYTVYKALTAAKLAWDLTARGLPAVPVFWMATEDHDYAEVSHCHVYGAARRPVRIESEDASDQRPVGRIPVGGHPASVLRESFGDLPFAAEVAGLAESCYPSGCTFGEGFAALASRLLKSYGVLLLDPLSPALRRLAAPILAEAASRHGDLIGRLIERSRELEARGYHAQVKVAPGGSLFFSLEGGRRLPAAAGKWPSRPEDLSPNALLRPVVQDFMMPTVAVVMGPAEVAYMAQAGVVYDALLGRMPVVVNRASFTLLDGRSARLLERHGLSLGELERGEDAVRERIAAGLVPAGLSGSLANAASETSARLERLKAELAAFDPSLAEAAARSGRKILYQLDNIARKTAGEALRRDARAAEDAGRLVRLLYPDRRMQERYYSILPFLAEHGMGLLDGIFEALDPLAPSHQLLPV